MKKLLFCVVAFFISFPFIYAQEIRLPPTVVSSAGNGQASEKINISKWRLGQVHLVTLNRKGEEFPVDWQFSVYPNPARTDLHIKFEIDSKKNFRYEVFDVKGENIIGKDFFPVIPGEDIQFDVSKFRSGLYLLYLIPEDDGNPRVVKFEKH